jgi:hypothetical protein
MERILCAALLYNGHIVSGYRHSDCYLTIANVLGIETDCDDWSNKIPNMPGRREQGFLTSTNRFVGRAEAFTIAKEANQLKLGYSEGQEKILTSEDLN